MTAFVQAPPRRTSQLYLTAEDYKESIDLLREWIDDATGADTQPADK